MSYQPYPGGGSYQPYPGGNQPYPGGNQMGARPPRPQSVKIAVWLMYGGAALSALSAILVLAVASRIKSAVGKALVTANATAVRQGKKPLTVAQMHDIEQIIVVLSVVVLLIGVALWLWMAWANNRGRPWARVVASVLFGLNSLYLILVISRAGTSTLFVGLGWLVGLGAIIMLWQRDSNAYFKPGSF
jgi:hypothetical protein